MVSTFYNKITTQKRICTVYFCTYKYLYIARSNDNERYNMIKSNIENACDLKKIIILNSGAWQYVLVLGSVV